MSKLNNLCPTRVSQLLLLIPLLLLTSAAWGQSGTLTRSDFGMQCGQSTGNCPVNGSGVITLPTEPGTLRLWDSQVEWSAINPNCATPPCTSWNWNFLDPYLDAIAADTNLKSVIYTFGWVPCWDAAVCNDPTHNRTSNPPSDLTSSGSTTFNAFVTALVQHCSPAGHCVKTYIKSYEMWNEANSSTYWNVSPISTSTTKLYQLVKPAVTIIKANVTGATILTPSFTGSGESWAQSWVSNEVASGIISNLYNFHIYLNTSTPETVYTTIVAPGTSSSPGQLYPNFNTTGWTARPWLISETNFQTFGTMHPFTCSTAYTVADCSGQVVRWQLIVNSNGALSLDWYNWNSTIGDLGSATNYATAYYYMELYMLQGSFPAACSFTTTGGIQTWSCPFTESGGTTALWVWTPSEAGTTFTVPSGYIDYRDLSGGTTSVTAGSHINISVEPILLEK
jgi:hypothetical protein